MNIKIIAVGSIKEKYLSEAVQEYSKRISKFGNLEIIEIEEERLTTNPSAKEIQRALEKEEIRIFSKLDARQYIIGLVIEGNQQASEKFSQTIQNALLDGYHTIVFIIGGSYGLSPAVKEAVALKLSFSKMTFPHQLMRVVLLEQIYRILKILHHEPYHK